MAAITHDVSSMGNSGSQCVLDLPCGVDVGVCVLFMLSESPWWCVWGLVRVMCKSVAYKT